MPEGRRKMLNAVAALGFATAMDVRGVSLVDFLEILCIRCLHTMPKLEQERPPFAYS